MSVVFHRSPGKMILKSFVAVIVLSFAWIKSVAGSTSYSNVYMQSGPSLGFYGPPAVRSTQLAPLSAAPLMSSLLPPCVSPCVVPSQQVASLTPVATSSANFVTYKSPIRVPVVVAPSNDDATSYEYSYVVYDENTGDQKAQKESSDGSVVRGQYSLIQPDGYVREVQYTADDIKGFNAVVKNFLPEGEAKAIPPCPEIKSEPLKEAQNKTDEAHDLEPEAHGEVKEEKHSHEGESPEEHKAHAKPKLEGHESHVKHSEPEKNENLGGREKTESHEKHEGYEDRGKPAEPKGHEETTHEERGETKEQKSPEEHTEPESHGESQTAEKHGSEGKDETSTTQSFEVLPIVTDALVSYNDVIKCIQSAIKRANTPQPLASPLTYIVLNKPC
ncbi:high mobility group nucleosome-binding domain-containing protein 5-like [Cydia fagiglandana]|uniref:high mobility group nucleosome-binding domain-containing protein 5-like n=1 Tax=Cydia fagiglandana TaxID=1458189 RepID=UPI002FEE4922